MTGRALSQVHKLLFLIASKGRWRLVLPASDGRYATCVRAGPEMAAQQLARKARRILAERHLEGLVIVAPGDELDTLRASLQRFWFSSAPWPRISMTCRTMSWDTSWTRRFTPPGPRDEPRG